jgi:hypothetical protein
MSIAGGLIKLYPVPFRARWGVDLRIEADTAGPRSWPSLALGLIDAWLHPAIWPAATRAQRQSRAATMVMAVTLIGWLVGHALFELDSLVPSDIAHSWVLQACDVVTLFGTALIVPRPRLSIGSVTSIALGALRRLAVPVILGIGVVVAVRSGPVPNALPLLRPVVLTLWWLALALGAIQSCRIVASLRPTQAAPPRRPQTLLGMSALATSLGISAAVVLWSGGGLRDPLSTGVGACLLILATSIVVGARDLSGLPASR